MKPDLENPPKLILRQPHYQKIPTKHQKNTNKKLQKNTPLASLAWGHDPLDFGAIVDHGSLLESLQFDLSSSLSLPFPSPCLWEEKEKKKEKKERRPWEKREGRKKKMKMKRKVKGGGGMKKKERRK
jgi:hypothetical protein